MSTILIHLTVDDFDHFLTTFETRGLPLRRRHGCRGARVLRHADDDERVALLLDWDPEAFGAFMADPEVRASMQAGGAIGRPDVLVLDDVRELDA